MRVALVAQPFDGVLPPRQNSIGLIAYNTAIELGREIDVTLYSKGTARLVSRNHLPFKSSFVSAAIDDALQHVASRYPRWASRLGIAALADEYPGYVLAITKELDRSGCEVVHVMNYWSWCRRLRGRKGNRRVVLEMQSEWLSQMDHEQVSHELEAVDAVVAVSDHIARLFRGSFKAYRGPVVTAYNGVNVEDFQPVRSNDNNAADEVPILFVGRVSPEKGIHTLVEAFAKIASRFERARLVIVGGRTTLREDFLVGISSDPVVQALSRFYNGSVSTDYQSYLDGLIKRLKLRDKVRFLGQVPHKELPDWYRSSKVVVNPSLSESFGISIVEGMACGLPVVGTKVGGMLETILDGETGLLLEPERPDLLANAVVALLDDEQTAARIGANGRARALEHFSWRSRAVRLLSAYRMLSN